MEKYLLFLYDHSVALWTMALFTMPFMVHYSTAKGLSVIARSQWTIALAFFALILISSCFIPLVLPPVHVYIIVPNMMFVAICLIAICYNLWVLRRDRLQFSLRTLLIVITLVAVVLGTGICCMNRLGVTPPLDHGDFGSPQEVVP